MTVLVGGVSQLYQGDLDLGRVVVQRLEGEQLGRDVTVEDLHYGGVAVAQRLEDVRPDTLVLVGAASRGRPPGSVQRRRIQEVTASPAELQESVAGSVTGYVGIDLVIEVAAGLGVLPARTITIEVEPAVTGPSDQLSAEAESALDEALELVRAEVRRAPLLELVPLVRESLADGNLGPSAALEAMEALLDELDILDREGRWGATFRERDRLRLRIGMGETSEGMTHADWGMWWAMIEELDRLQQLEVSALD